MRFRHLQPGRGGWSGWVEPCPKGYRLRCCDCGLVHEMDFRVTGVRKLRVQFRARRAK